MTPPTRLPVLLALAVGLGSSCERKEPSSAPPDGRVVVAVTAGEIRVDDEVVFAIPADDSLAEGEIAALVSALARRCGSTWATIVVDGDVRYGTLFPVTFSVRRAGCRNFDLRQRGGATIVHPADYPDRTTERDPAAPPLGGKLALTITVTRDRLQMSSGTHELFREFDRAAGLGGALGELVTDCWPTAARTVEDEQVFVVARREVSMDRLLPVLQATVAPGFPRHVFLPPHLAGRSSPRDPAPTAPAPAGDTLAGCPPRRLDR